MESAEATPPKIRRMHKTANLHVSECIRQFRLPQQFPSTVVGHRPVPREYPIKSPKNFRHIHETQPKIVTYSKQKISTPSGAKNVQAIYKCASDNIVHQIASKKVLNGTRMVRKTTSSQVASNGLKTIQKASLGQFLSKEIKTIKKLNSVSSTSLATNGDLQSKLKTLKLKSPDGKELGEFRVKVLDQSSDSLKRKLVTVSKAVSSKDESQGSAVVSSTQGEPVVSYSIKDFHYPGAIYQDPRVGKVGNEQNSKIKIISDISLNRPPPNQAVKTLHNKEIIEKKQENGLLDSISNTKIKHPFITIDSNRVVVSNNETKNSGSKINTKKVLYLRPEDHPYLKNITQSGKPISLKPLKLKTLSVNRNIVLARENASESSNFMGTGGLQGYKNGDMDEELEDGEVATASYSIESNKMDQDKVEGNSSKSRKSVTVMVPNGTANNFSRQSYSGSSSDMGSLQYSDEEDELGSSETFDTDDSLEQGFMHHNKNTENEGPKILRNNVHNTIRQRNFEISKRKIENMMQKNSQNESSVNETSADITILERALASVKDKGLREEALKILASCKLGADRQVPIPPPSDILSLRDTTTQTNIFGNLDRECEEFIEVKEDAKGLKRIKKQMKNQSVDCKSLNAILTSVDEKHTGTQYTSQLDKMLNNLDLGLNNMQKVNQIKEVLNKPIKSNEWINQVRIQIQKDMKMLTDYDENGLLGLHKAIIEDNSLVVKRLLLIIKVSKKDIDVKTLDGKTSLELALKTDAGPDIVNALLEAGAKPTSKETGHESALLIASKNSSPLLPQLIKYANKEGLSSMDSEGFAAIHHCALRGNMTAIHALIEAGEDIDLPDCRSGRTALFHAIENQHPETARQLIGAGAKPNIRNNDGHTILPLLEEVRNQTLKPVVYKSMKWN